MYIVTTVLIIGVVVGITLIGINIRTRRTLLGSFFKRSYGLATIGCLFFTFGFAIQLFSYFEYEGVVFEVVHHTLLLLSIIFFTLVGMNFPKEAGEALAEKLKETEKRP